MIGIEPSIKFPAIEVMSDHYSSNTFGISYKDKVILDLGASNGDAADYFYSEGAKQVICVEGSPNYYPDLLKNSKLFQNLIPIPMFIYYPLQIELLILKYKPDIIKADIEGAELHLVNMKDEIWSMVPEYLMELHWGYVGIICSFDDVYNKLKKNNYNIIKELPIYNRMIYVRKEE